MDAALLGLVPAATRPAAGAPRSANAAEVEAAGSAFAGILAAVPATPAADAPVAVDGGPGVTMSKGAAAVVAAMVNAPDPNAQAPLPGLDVAGAAAEAPATAAAPSVPVAAGARASPVAAATGISAYELITQLSERVTRQYIGD